MDLYKDFANADQVALLTEKYRTGIGWGEAKEALFLAMNENLKTSRENYNAMMANTDQLEIVLQAGAKKARERAQSVLMRVRKAIGLNS
jgi:tryptophanyl-tRNA synthetase